MNVETSYHLNDNQWHSVSVERNRKEARLVVDGSLKAEVREPLGPVRALHLTSRLALGATIDYRDGFTGCMRALLLNGLLIDLRKEANKGLYGISPGCVGRCDSNPCLNNGTCTERYDGYNCDCRWSAFKGPICADGKILFNIFFFYFSFALFVAKVIFFSIDDNFFPFFYRNRSQSAIKLFRQIRFLGLLAFYHC